MPVPYATISLAIDAAFDGDVIEVSDGTYTEVLEIEYEEKSITIRSVNGPAVTIIDAIGTETGALKVTNSNSITIEGFTITSSDPVESNKVTAIASSGTSLTVNNCIITDNYSENGTSALYFSGEAGDHLTLTNSTISNNSGGGAAVRIYGEATISDTSFIDNTPRSSDGSGGGALLVSTDAVVTVNDSLFTGNVKSNAGAAIGNSGAEVTINSSVLKGNSSTASAGGAIYSTGSGSYTYVTNCMITGNSAGTNGGGVGSGAWNRTYIYNSTIASNSAASAGGVYEYPSFTYVYVYNSIIRGNYAPESPQILGPTVTYSNVEGVIAGTGNIDIDPLFVDPKPYSEAPTTAGDYHLSAGSPSIDTADPAVAPDNDFEGDPRPIGLGVDMGADEYTTL